MQPPSQIQPLDAAFFCGPHLQPVLTGRYCTTSPCGRGDREESQGYVKLPPVATAAL